MPWADLDDAVAMGAMVGVTVTQLHLDVAQETVELFSGTTEAASDAGNISERNLRLLEMATRYQAVYVAAHPELFVVQDVTSASQDGASANYAHADAQLLAPLAHRSILKLSWRQRGLRVRRPGMLRPETDYGNRDSATRDDSLDWSPL